jgi:tetratricopeptide (TPR) repeat protein
VGNLGLTLVHRGDYARARQLLEEGLRLNNELGSPLGISGNLNNMALAILRQGHLEEAQSLFVRSLRLKGELRWADGVPYGLEGLAELAAVRGQWARAVRLLAAADTAREAVGHPRCPPSECANCERLLALAREALGAEAFAVAWSEGRAWSTEQVMVYATQEVEPDRHGC